MNVGCARIGSLFVDIPLEESVCVSVHFVCLNIGKVFLQGGTIDCPLGRFVVGILWLASLILALVYFSVAVHVHVLLLIAAQ